MLQDIISSKKALFQDGVQTILRGQESRSRRVVLLKGNLVQNVRNENRGVNARVNRNGMFGFASVAEYTPEAAERVLRAASENADFLGRHSGKKIVLPPSTGTGHLYCPGNIMDTEQKRIIDFCRTVDDYIQTKYPDLSSRTVVYMEQSMDKIILTSDAYSGQVVNPRAHLYIVMDSETKDGVPVQISEAFGGYGGFDDHFTDVTTLYEGIEQVYRRLMGKKEGVYAEAGYKTVILGGMMGGMLAHEAVGHTVEADLVRGGSVAGPNLGKQVASELVSLVDFAHTFQGDRAPLPVYLDDEGTKAEDALLIQNGILTGYMNDRESAAEYGMKAAGNARTRSFSDEPLIRMRNTCILPGTSTFEEMIASVDDGYYLIQSGNGQADLTGEFMFGVTCGYEIKNGKLGKALLDTTVTGVAFDMLKTVDMVSNKVEWSAAGTCGKKQAMACSLGGPHMRCKIMIGGR
ncbi:MAG: TldD/PmbA family protein [Lachnospiraceae bacterium]|nr:TldD/PmbA family protein [Lachnospiraceae bacterium]